MKMFSKSLIAISLLTAASVVHASEGFYLGVNVGQANYDINANEFASSIGAISTVVSCDVDDSDTSLSFTLGYQLNPYISFEGGYINLGEFCVDTTVYENPYFIDVNLAVETDGLFFDIKGQVPINEVFGIYGKIGFLKWESDLTATASEANLGSYSTSDSIDDDDVFYGIGGSILINKNNSVTLNIDYTLYDLDDLDVDVLSAGLQFSF